MIEKDDTINNEMLQPELASVLQQYAEHELKLNTRAVDVYALYVYKYLMKI